MKNINLNFGCIRDSIIRVIGTKFLSESDDRSVISFIKEVKNNPILHKQFLIYKSIEGCKPFDKDRLAERFLSQNLKLIQGVEWNDVLNENRQIRKKFIEDSHVESNGSRNNDLFNSIHVLMETSIRSTPTNVTEDQKAYETVLNHLTRKVVNENDKSKEKIDNPHLLNSDFILKIAVNNFNKRFEHLNEGEKKIFKMLIAEGNYKDNYIEELRTDIISLINEKLEKEQTDSTIEVLKECMKKVNNKEGINKIDKDDIILEFFELKETLISE